MNSQPLHIISPARICLFGDHQDYLQLPVIACAINRFLHFTARANGTDKFLINLKDTGEKRCLSVGAAQPQNHQDYWVSGLNVLRRQGLTFTSGYDMDVTGNIPINAGLSSSSALVVGWLRFLCATKEMDPLPDQLARWAYETEVLEFNQPGGLMDQYTISIGNILHIDTRPPTAVQVLGNRLNGLIVAESGIPKSTLGTLGSLREMAQKSISIIKASHPDFNLQTADLTSAQTLKNQLPADLQAVFTAAIENHQITLEAVKTFNETPDNIEKLGYLMRRHHEVLRDKLKITVPKMTR